MRGWVQLGGVDAQPGQVIDGEPGGGASLVVGGEVGGGGLAPDVRVDDADVAGDAVIGAIGLTDRDTTTGMSSFALNYPFCVDGAID